MTARLAGDPAYVASIARDHAQNGEDLAFALREVASITAAIDGVRWRGEAQQAFVGRLQQLHAPLAGLEQAASAVGDVLDSFAHELAALLEQWEVIARQLAKEEGNRGLLDSAVDAVRGLVANLEAAAAEALEEVQRQLDAAAAAAAAGPLDAARRAVDSARATLREREQARRWSEERCRLLRGRLDTLRAEHAVLCRRAASALRDVGIAGDGDWMAATVLHALPWSGQADDGPLFDLPQPLPHDAGAGEWNSEPWYAKGEDAVVADELRKVVLAWYAMGYTNAAMYLQHYLGNTGERVAVDVAQLLRDCPKLRAAVDAELAERVRKAVDMAKTGGRYGVRIPLDDGWEVHEISWGENPDWFLAMHGMNYSVSGYAVVHPGTPERIEVHYATHVHDPYNWDRDETSGVGPVQLPQEIVGGLHTAGIAQEFVANGSTGERVVDDWNARRR